MAVFVLWLLLATAEAAGGDQGHYTADADAPLDQMMHASISFFFLNPGPGPPGADSPCTYVRAEEGSLAMKVCAHMWNEGTPARCLGRGFFPPFHFFLSFFFLLPTTVFSTTPQEGAWRGAWGVGLPRRGAT